MASTDSKHSSRKRLVPLLEARLNDQRIPQLVWIDKEKKIVRMPWRHHKSARWGGPEAFMLRELAKVMYNYSGPDIPTKKDLSEWKGWLRNNLKTLSDFDEVPEMHVLDGNNPYKVYRFVSNGTKHCNRSNNKAVRGCQGPENNCRRNNVHVAATENMVDANNFLDFLDGSVDHGCSLMWHAGIPSCGNATCDQVNMSSRQKSAYQEETPSVVSSYTNGSNGRVTTLSYQDDEQDIFEELFPNNGMALQETKQFDIDDLNDALRLGPNESSDNSSSENVSYLTDGLNFFDDSPSQAILSMSDVGDDICNNSTDENVNIFNSQRSAYQQRYPYVASSCSNGTDGSVNSLLHPDDQEDISGERFHNVSSSHESAYQQRSQYVANSCSSGIDGSVNSSLSDQDDLSRERFLNLGFVDDQNANQFDVGALQFDVSPLQFDGFDFEFSESKVQSNNFRSRSPLTTGLDPNFAFGGSHAGSSCDTDLGNSTQRVSPNRLSQQHLATRGVVYNNIPHVVTPLSVGINDATCASSTEASRDTSMASDLVETPVHSDLLTAEGTSPEMFNNITVSGFSHRTFLSLTRMLSIHKQLPLGVEVRYYNSPPIQPRMMPGEFRICFVEDSDEREIIASYRNDGLIGPQNVHRLELPPAQNCTRLSKSQIDNTNHVLNNLKGGIVVSFNKGHIYATRYCKAGTMYSVSGQAGWEKLDRLIPVKIFDYGDYTRSYSSPNQILNAQPFVRLSFGAKNPKKAITMLVLTIDIWSMEALLLAREVEENCSSLEPDLALSNEFDKILSIGEMLKKSAPPTV